MITRDDLPPTPDWLPTPCNDGCVRLDMDQWAQLKAHAESPAWVELRAHADPPAHEAQPLTWSGDQA